MALVSLLTALVANTALTLEPSTISTMAVAVGGLIAYYTPSAEADFKQQTEQ
jgi:hypothetical protein